MLSRPPGSWGTHSPTPPSNPSSPGQAVFLNTSLSQPHGLVQMCLHSGRLISLDVSVASLLPSKPLQSISFPQATAAFLEHRSARGLSVPPASRLPRPAAGRVKSGRPVLALGQGGCSGFLRAGERALLPLAAPGPAILDPRTEHSGTLGASSRDGAPS